MKQAKVFSWVNNKQFFDEFYKNNYRDIKFYFKNYSCLNKNIP